MTGKRFISKDESIINIATDELVNASSEESAEIIVDWLNEFAEENGELQNENKELKEEIIKWKSKYFDAMDIVIGEYSTNIKEDMEELEKEVWGDDDD